MTGIICTLIAYGIYQKYGMLGLFSVMVFSLVVVLLTPQQEQQP